MYFLCFSSPSRDLPLLTFQIWNMCADQLQEQRTGDDRRRLLPAGWLRSLKVFMLLSGRPPYVTSMGHERLRSSDNLRWSVSFLWFGKSLHFSYRGFAFVKWPFSVIVFLLVIKAAGAGHDKISAPFILVSSFRSVCVQRTHSSDVIWPICVHLFVQGSRYWPRQRHQSRKGAMGPAAR